MFFIKYVDSSGVGSGIVSKWNASGWGYIQIKLPFFLSLNVRTQQRSNNRVTCLTCKQRQPVVWFLTLCGVTPRTFLMMASRCCWHAHIHTPTQIPTDAQVLLRPSSNGIIMNVYEFRPPTDSPNCASLRISLRFSRRHTHTHTPLSRKSQSNKIYARWAASVRRVRPLLLESLPRTDHSMLRGLDFWAGADPIFQSATSTFHILMGKQSQTPSVRQLVVCTCGSVLMGRLFVTSRGDPCYGCCRIHVIQKACRTLNVDGNFARANFERHMLYTMYDDGVLLTADQSDGWCLSILPCVETFYGTSADIDNLRYG